MTIRSTTDSTSKRVKRDPKGTREGFETVLAGVDEANAVTIEQRGNATQAAFNTTNPSNDHNGTVV